MSLLRGPRPRGAGRKGPRRAAAVKRDWDVSASPSRVPSQAPGLLRPRRLFPLLLRRLAGSKAGAAAGLLLLGDARVAPWAFAGWGRAGEPPCPRTCRLGGGSVERSPSCVGG